MENNQDDYNKKILYKIKEIYDKTVEYLYCSLTNIESLLNNTNFQNISNSNIYNKEKKEKFQKSTNKILNSIKERYAKDLKNNSNNNKILYKSKLLNFYLKEIFDDRNEKEEFFFPFYLLSYIMIIINHHEICLSEYFNGKIKINEFKSEDIDKNFISVILRCFIFIEMFSLYFQLKCLNSSSNLLKENNECEVIINLFKNLEGNNLKSKEIINELNEDERKEVKILSYLSYNIIIIFLYVYEEKNNVNNNNSENILNQLINFSLLSYKDGIKTLIRKSKLKKEKKIKILKYKNLEYNNETLNLIYNEIKDNYHYKNLINNEDTNINNINNIDDNKNKNKENNNKIIDDKINNNDLRNIIKEQNNKIEKLTSELNELKTEFNNYKYKMDNIVKLLENKLKELEIKPKNNVTNQET